MAPKKDPSLDLSFLLNQKDNAKPLRSLGGSSPRRGSAFAGSPSTASSHQLTKTESKYLQNHCSSVLINEQDANNHKRTTHDREKSFKCDICHKLFGEKGNLSKHRRSVHLNERPFACSHCHKSFAFKDGLVRHINLVHLNHRPFVCDSCGLGFKQVSQLRRHSKSCNGTSAGADSKQHRSAKR